MKNFYKPFFAVFSYRSLPIHIAMWAITYVCVITGLDWAYFQAVNHEPFMRLFQPALFVGFFVPFLLPPALYVFGQLRKNIELKQLGLLEATAALLGWVTSSLYKAFTGRLSPHMQVSTTGGYLDTSHTFNFGFLRDGIFWGWPSSHTAVAFAMAVAFAVAYGKRMRSSVLVILYALYIGIGVSLGAHWLSDVVAGVLLGSLVGYAVGMAYKPQG